MEIKIMSDLHLEFYRAGQTFPYIGSGDILILAGDILCAKHLNKDGDLRGVYLNFMGSCSKAYQKVIYVKGNHEFYGYNYEGAHKTIKNNLPGNFTLLENECLAIGGWNFIGFTLWTNFRNANPLEMMEAEQCMNDYKVIRIGSNYRKLRAQDTLNFHLDSRDYLLNQLKCLGDNVFVVSHHAPSFRSVHEDYREASNGAYCSNLEGIIYDNPSIKYWVHGHTHNFFDYPIGGCRVICNPAGYLGTETGFRPDFSLTL